MNQHTLSPNSPGAHPTLAVLSGGVGVSRAPGILAAERAAAIVRRYWRRPLFLLMAEPPARYERMVARYHALMHASFPGVRTKRIGRALRLEMQRDRDQHDAILEQLGYRYCPQACAICDERARWAYEDRLDLMCKEGVVR